jgi:hypothetical protein
VQYASTVTAPPGAYQARLTVDGQTYTQPFTLLIDPNVAAEGVTTADLVELFDHNVKMRDLTTDVAQTLARVRTARGSASDRTQQSLLDEISTQIVNTPEGVRYNKPGLQEHVTYLAGMTRTGDQKLGRDALERYKLLRKQLDDLKAALDKILGPGK